MKTLKCKEVSGVACAFEACGETNEEAINVLFEHGSLQHKEMLDKMDELSEEKMFEKMNFILDGQD